MKQVIKLIDAQPTRDGAGVSLFRSLGTQRLPEANPFLMLDEIRADEASDYLAGFPDHPHRGFETVTIMLEGKMRHGDSRGNSGVIESGGVQWMTAGQGIVHSEMPEQESGRLWGFQLWVNLPAAHKMMAPRYQDIPAAQIPSVPMGDSTVRVMAGQVQGTRGPIVDIVTQPSLLDLHLADEIRLNLPRRSLLYVYQGSVQIGGLTVKAQQLALLSEEPELVVAGQGRALVFGAEPLNEPIARYGPFVMNSRDELNQAFLDYQQGRLG